MLYCGIMWVRVCSFSSLNYPSGEAGLIFHENLKKYRMNISSVDVCEHKTHRSEACRQLICVSKLPPPGYKHSLSLVGTLMPSGSWSHENELMGWFTFPTIWNDVGWVTG